MFNSMKNVFWLYKTVHVLLFPLIAIPPENCGLICTAHWGWGWGGWSLYRADLVLAQEVSQGMWRPLIVSGARE